MKKLWTTLILVIVVIAAALPNLAFAEGKEEQIAEFAKQSDYIVQAKCVVWEENCVLAIRTEKLLEKSEYEQLRLTLQNEIGDKFGLENVVITRNPKAMHMIERVSQMSGEERQKAVEQLIENLQKRPPVIQPR